MLANFKWPEPKDRVEHKLVGDVIEHKCHIVCIPEDDEGPSYSFSIGLHLHFNHPEIVIFGLGHQNAADAINGICGLVEKGRRFNAMELTNDVFSHLDTKLVNVPEKFYKDFFGAALWFYRSIGSRFPFLQVVWPDQHGCFPWDSGFNSKLKVRQPVLVDE